MTAPLTAERVDALIAKESGYLSRSEEALATITHPLDRAMLQEGLADKRDLLAILRDKAASLAQERAGATSLSHSGPTPVQCDEMSGAGTITTSPGPIDDERALEVLGHYCRDHFDIVPTLAGQALAHLRARLSAKGGTEMTKIQVRELVSDVIYEEGRGGKGVEAALDYLRAIGVVVTGGEK